MKHDKFDENNKTFWCEEHEKKENKTETAANQSDWVVDCFDSAQKENK